MLIPRTRLLGWVALIVLPFGTMATAIPTARAVCGTILALFGAAVLLDAILARGCLAGIGVRLPDLVRLQKDREGAIEMRLVNDSMKARTLRVGLPFPPEIPSVQDDQLALLPAGTARSLLPWKVLPRERGQYFIERVYLETASVLGFWAARGDVPVRSELRVYPNLFDERKNVAALFLKRGVLGAHAQRQAGQGREFEKLRDYLHGDSIEDVHWKASAKRGYPVTKVFQVERTQEVYVIIDASRLTARRVSGSKFQVLGSHGSHVPTGGSSDQPETWNLKPETTVLERFVTAGLILGLAAEQQGDQFGLLTFSDRVLSFVRAKNGQAHYDSCRDRLYTLQPQSVSPDFDELGSFIRLRLRKRALLIVLTSLDDPFIAESFVKSVELNCRQHLILVNMLAPAGARPVFTESVMHLDDIYQHLGGHLRWRQLRELEKVLHRRGVRLSLLDPIRLAAQLVAQLAEVKARQLV